MERRLTVQRVAWWMWLGLLVTIPVTSSPVVAFFSGGETPVSPLALIPLIFVVIFGLLPSFIKGEQLPSLIWPLILFVIFTLISSATSVALPLIPFKNQAYPGRLARGLLTLGIGLSFYLAAVLIPKGDHRIKQSIRAIYVGLVVLLLWSSVQAWLVLDGSNRMPLVVRLTHHLFSVRDPLWDRVTGMAFEPSWLGDQLVVLYLPLLFASVIKNYTVFEVKWRRLSPELVLLFWGLFILSLTQSRISFLSLFGVATAVFFYLGLRLIRILTRHLEINLAKWSVWITGIFLLCAVWAALLYSSGWVLSKVDERMVYLLRAPTRLEEFAYFSPNEAWLALADQLAFAERISYWIAGLRTFSVHPILGVGPGNMGFFFEKHLPAYAHELTEIQRALQLSEYGFPNPKNFWIRLLAEDGLFGFASYFTWFLLTAFGSLMLWKKHHEMASLIGLAGAIAVITFFMEGFSLDTYALPHPWIIFGLVANLLKGEVVDSGNLQRASNGSMPKSTSEEVSGSGDPVSGRMKSQTGMMTP